MALAPGRRDLLHLSGTLLGTACLVGSANVFNCWLERDRDARMRRTRLRPLAARRVEPGLATSFGLLLLLLSVALLGLESTRLPLMLGLLAFVVYVGVYTPMKVRSWWALPVGAIPGALPPLMGWVSIQGSMGAGGIALFALLLAWQVPHFLAIALFRRGDYRAAGFEVFPLVFGEQATRVALVVSSLLLLAVSLVLPLVGLGGVAYGCVAGAFGCAGVLATLRGAMRKAGGGWARGMFRFTLVHLTALIVALLCS